jgi:hypothetical protein
MGLDAMVAHGAAVEFAAFMKHQRFTIGRWVCAMWSRTRARKMLRNRLARNRAVERAPATVCALHSRCRPTSLSPLPSTPVTAIEEMLRCWTAAASEVLTHRRRELLSQIRAGRARPGGRRRVPRDVPARRPAHGAAVRVLCVLSLSPRRGARGAYLSLRGVHSWVYATHHTHNTACLRAATP